MNRPLSTYTRVKKQGAERKAFVSYPGRQRRIDYRFSFTKPGHASLLVRLVPSNGHPARRSRGTLRLRASRNPRKYSNTHSNRAKFLFSRIRDNESFSSSSLLASLTPPPPFPELNRIVPLRNCDRPTWSEKIVDFDCCLLLRDDKYSDSINPDTYLWHFDPINVWLSVGRCCTISMDEQFLKRKWND